jgi:hypothetical protein
MNHFKQKCSTHPEKHALSFCNSCKEFFCSSCISEAADYYYCSKPSCKLSAEVAATEKALAIRSTYSKWFCNECLDTTDNHKESKSFRTVNGIGARLIGRSEVCKNCHSFVSSVWFCFCFIPIFPLERYRVVRLGSRQVVTRGLRTKTPK